MKSHAKSMAQEPEVMAGLPPQAGGGSEMIYLLPIEKPLRLRGGKLEEVKRCESTGQDL